MAATMGRPRKADPKIERICIPATPAEKAAFQAAADAEERPLAQFIRRAVVAAIEAQNASA